ncbi:MAG: cytochrome P450 [Pseudomonadota bacterium]
MTAQAPAHPPYAPSASTTQTATLFRSRLVTPPQKPLGALRRITTFVRNPAALWHEDMYVDGHMASRTFGKTYATVAWPDAIRTVLLDAVDCFERSYLMHRILSEAMGRGLLTSDGEAWRRQRAIAAPVFRQQVLDGFVPVVDDAARGCAARLRAGAGRERAVLPDMLTTAMDIIVETLFGEADFDRKQTVEDIGVYISTIGHADVFDLFNAPQAVPRPWKAAGRRAVARLRATALAVLAQKRADPGETRSLTARLLAARDPETGEGLSDTAIVDNVVTFIGAGHETTSVGLSWSLYLLAHAPDLQDAVAEEARAALADGASPDAIDKLELTARVFQEAMRLYPPVAGLARNVVKPVTVGPYDLAPGDHVTIAVLPLHRNRRLWPDADGFDPARFSPDAVKARDKYAYLPFGAGPRICIGWKFAMMEGALILARMVEACRFALGDAAPPRPVIRITMRPENGAPLVATPR